MQLASMPVDMGADTLLLVAMLQLMLVAMLQLVLQMEVLPSMHLNLVMWKMYSGTTLCASLLTCNAAAAIGFFLFGLQTMLHTHNII